MAARKVQKKPAGNKKQKEESASEEMSESEESQTESEEETGSEESEEESGSGSNESGSAESEEGEKNNAGEEESESEDEPNENPRDKRTAFIKGFSVSTTEENLKKLFSKYGEIKEIRMPKLRDTRTADPRGIAYVEFEKKKACRDSFELDGTEFNGNTITVNLAKAAGAPRGEGREQRPGEKTLFIGNLPFEIEKEKLVETLREYADVRDVRLPTSKETGRPRGFGFAVFDSAEEADKLLSARINYDGRDLRIHVSETENGRGRDGGRDDFRGRAFDRRGDDRRGDDRRGGFGRNPSFPKRTSSENNSNSKQSKRLEFE